MSIEIPNVEGTTSIQTSHINEAATFPLGRVVATPGALAYCEEHKVSPLSLIARHHRGDWGDLVKDDKIANENALFSGGRLLSAYLIAGERIYIITEWDRSATTLLLAREY